MQLPSVCGWLTGKKGRDYPALRAWSRPCEAKRPGTLMRRFGLQDGKYVIVADLGTDDLTVYRVDRENRVLCADAVP